MFKGSSYIFQFVKAHTDIEGHTIHILEFYFTSWLLAQNN